MERQRLVSLAVACCLAVVMSGCGSSSESGIAPLSIATFTVPQAVVNVPYNVTLSATGGVVPYAWNVASGSLPPGLSLSRAGVLSGTPTATGGFGFGVAVADSRQPPSIASAQLSISVNAVLQVTTTSLPNGSPGVFYSATLSAIGGISPYSWALTQGSLPNGLTLNATTGVISGTPTATGTSSFTVEALDSEATAATAGLRIVINPPPTRNAALYTSDQTGLQIQSDGSLTLLPSSPESAINGGSLASSPILPLLFLLGTPPTNYLESLLVNQDYSLSSYSQAPLQATSDHYGRPEVDPTGSNLYLPGPIDSNLTPGIAIYPANGSLQESGSIAIPNVDENTPIVFSPDGTLAFIATCPNPATDGGSILSYSRSSEGVLTLVATNNGPGCTVVGPMTVSPDGKYLATAEVQIYSIASDGTLTPILPQPFTVALSPQGGGVFITDMTWEQSSSFLLVSTTTGLNYAGGIAVLSFSGSALTESVYPASGGTGRIQRTGTLVYAMQLCPHDLCGGPSGVLGFDFQNGQLISLPGSPYPYGEMDDMVIY